MLQEVTFVKTAYLVLKNYTHGVNKAHGLARDLVHRYGLQTIVPKCDSNQVMATSSGIGTLFTPL